MTWIGTVTRIVDGYPYARVPDLGGDREFGPLESVAAGLVGGERVLVAQLAKQPGDAIVIVGVLA